MKIPNPRSSRCPRGGIIAGAIPAGRLNAGLAMAAQEPQAQPDPPARDVDKAGNPASGVVTPPRIDPAIDMSPPDRTTITDPAAPSSVQPR